MDDKKSGFLWNVHSYINEYIRFADTKAELIIAWNTAVIGGLLAGNFHKGFDTTSMGIARMIAFGTLVLSFTCACWAVRPRLRTTQSPGFIFWQSILAYKTKNEFVAELKKADDLDDHVAGHLFDLSGVSSKKYFWVAISIWLGFLGSIACGTLYITG